MHIDAKLRFMRAIITTLRSNPTSSSTPIVHLIAQVLYIPLPATSCRHPHTLFWLCNLYMHVDDIIIARARYHRLTCRWFLLSAHHLRYDPLPVIAVCMHVCIR